MKLFIAPYSAWLVLTSIQIPSALLRIHHRACSTFVFIFFFIYIDLALVAGVTSEKPPLMAKPKDATSQLHFTLPNGRVPAGSVALPGIHSVAAARAALASTNGVSVGVGVNSTMPAGRAFNLRSSHLATAASGADAIPASPTFQLPPFPESGHQFYGLPSSFHKNKDRPSNLAPSTSVATTISSAAATTTASSAAAPTSASTAKQGKSGGSKHWLSCYNSSNSQTPTPSPSDKEEDSETPSPTDHGFKMVPASAALERPTSLAVRGFEAVWQSGGESLKTGLSFLRPLVFFSSSRLGFDLKGFFFSGA